MDNDEVLTTEEAQLEKIVTNLETLVEAINGGEE